MRATTGFVSVCCVALFGIAASSVSAGVDAQTRVLAKDLNAARTPGKVAAVIWTVRAEHCTLQVVFPNAGRIAEAMRVDPKLKPGRPSVQVWLLKADGTLIAPTQRLDPSNAAGGKNPRKPPYGVEVLFAFPLSADKEAVAAAIRVDDAFYIEPLKTLVEQQGA
jgi:hypothetical protein